MLKFFIILTLGGGLYGCGFKGPLYMPAKKAAPVASAPTVTQKLASPSKVTSSAVTKLNASNTKSSASNTKINTSSGVRMIIASAAK